MTGSEGEQNLTVFEPLVCRALLPVECAVDGLFMAALRSCPVVSFFYLFYSSPNLSGRRLDVYHTSTHGVALVRIYNAGLKPAARGSLQIQDAKKSPKIAIWAPSHNFVGLYLRN